MRAVLLESAVLLELAVAAPAAAAHLDVQDAAAELAAAAPPEQDAPGASDALLGETVAPVLAEHDAPAPVGPASFAAADPASFARAGPASFAGVQDAASEPAGPGASGAAVREVLVAFSWEQPVSTDTRVALLAGLARALSLGCAHSRAVQELVHLADANLPATPAVPLAAALHGGPLSADPVPAGH